MWGQDGSGGGIGGNPWPPPPVPVESQQYSMNPNHYANIPHNQVDWAALAQQWIMLKEVSVDSNPRNSGPSPQSRGIPQQHHHHSMIPPNSHHQLPNIHFPPPSVPRGISPRSQPVMPMPPGILSPMMENAVIPTGDVIGEAPMDVEPLDQPDMEAYDSPNNAQDSGGWSRSSSWFAPENNNPWNTALNASASVVNHTGYSTAPVPTPQTQQRPRHPHPPSFPKGKKSSYNNSSTFKNLHSYSEAAAGSPSSYDASSYSTPSGGYWSSNDPSGDVMGASSQNYISAAGTVSGYSSDENSMPDFDAAKRKALPIWIREGLEKMEREKKRKEEITRKEAEREEMRKRRAAENQNKVEENTITESKWASSRGPSDDEDEEDVKAVTVKSASPREESLAEVLKKLSKEDRDEAIMYAIRRVCTSVLCKITDQEILQAASESYTRSKSKKATSTMHVRKIGALASLTGGALGLGGYGSDSDPSEEEDRADDVGGTEPDSEEELLAEIQRKKRNWELKRLTEEGRASRSRSKSSGPPTTSTSPAHERSEERTLENDHINKSNVKDKREVEKPIVTGENSGSDMTTKRNGRLNSSDSGGLTLLQSDRNEKKERTDERKKNDNSISIKNRYKSRSRSPKKVTKRRSSSRDSRRRPRSRSRSVSLGSSRRARSKSYSKDRKRKYKQSRSRSKSVDRRRRERSSSQSRRKHSKSRSNSRDRYRSKQRRLSKSRDVKRSRSRSPTRRKKSRSKSKERNKSRSPIKDRRKSRSISKGKGRRKSRSKSTERKKLRSRSRERKKSKSPVKQRHKSRSTSNENKKKSESVKTGNGNSKGKANSAKDKRSRKRVSKSRSRSNSSDSSKHVRNRKKKHKKRSHRNIITTSRSHSRSASSQSESNSDSSTKKFLKK